MSTRDHSILILQLQPVRSGRWQIVWNQSVLSFDISAGRSNPRQSVERVNAAAAAIIVSVAREYIWPIIRIRDCFPGPSSWGTQYLSTHKYRMLSFNANVIASVTVLGATAQRDSFGLGISSSVKTPDVTKCDIGTRSWE